MESWWKVHQRDMFQNHSVWKRKCAFCILLLRTGVCSLGLEDIILGKCILANLAEMLSMWQCFGPRTNVYIVKPQVLFHIHGINVILLRAWNNNKHGLRQCEPWSFDIFWFARMLAPSSSRLAMVWRGSLKKPKGSPQISHVSVFIG